MFAHGQRPLRPAAAVLRSPFETPQLGSDQLHEFRRRLEQTNASGRFPTENRLPIGAMPNSGDDGVLRGVPRTAMASCSCCETCTGCAMAV